MYIYIFTHTHDRLAHGRVVSDVYIYAYIYTYIFIYMYIYSYMYVFICMHRYEYICIHMHLYMYVQRGPNGSRTHDVYMNMCVCIYIYVCMCIYVYCMYKQDRMDHGREVSTELKGSNGISLYLLYMARLIKIH